MFRIKVFNPDALKIVVVISKSNIMNVISMNKERDD
jgi:hypothetical protein